MVLLSTSNASQFKIRQRMLDSVMVLNRYDDDFRYQIGPYQGQVIVVGTSDKNPSSNKIVAKLGSTNNRLEVIALEFFVWYESYLQKLMDQTCRGKYRASAHQ